METKAVIDIGTNTFHLLIAKVDGEKNIEIIHKNTIAVKLGEGGVNKGYIADAAYQRGINAMLQFKQELEHYKIEKVKTTATAAVRDASNGEQFIEEVLQKTGVIITIIDGLKEAEYIYLGTKAAQLLNNQSVLIMDIGGGSVEFIICNEQQIFWKHSYQLGAARLLADYYHNDEALSLTTIQNIQQHFKNQLANLFKAVADFKPQKLIGTAGSFNSFANIIAIQHHKTFDSNRQKSYEFKFDNFDQLLNQIIASNHQQRKDLKGLIPLRTDMILMAALLTKYILQQTEISEVVTCTYSLKEGLIISED